MSRTRTILTSLAVAAMSAAAVGMLATAATPAPATPPSHDDIAGKPALTSRDADRDLNRSIVVATFEHPLPDGKSVVWCSTMQLAWNELAAAMGGPLSTSQPADSPGGRAVAAFNTSTAGKQDLDADSYVALAGFGRDGILDRIRRELQDKFHGAASPKLLPREVGSDEIFAYSYLFKNLAFKDPFIRRRVPLSFGDAQVAAFGLWHDPRVENWSDIAKQVSILSYTERDHWAVELRSTSEGDRLIIARLPKADTLSATVAAALAMGKDAKPESMAGNDTLVIPLLNFDITRNYGELAGVPLRGSSVSGPVMAAVQNIRFRLDEKGAVLKSEAGIRTGAAIMKTREMVADGPFLIVMMRAGTANPYFVAWIDNPELLVPFAKQ